MPKYTTKKAAAAKRRQKTVTKSISRDKRILKRWAATGSAADYEKLRKYATKLADKAPDYVLPEVLRLLQTTDRRRLVEAIHADGNTGDANFVNNGLAWIINAMPTKNMKWAAQLQLNTMKGHTGDGITEQDEDYAKLIDATYRTDRPEIVEHWRRLPQYDSNYLGVWQNRDGHIYIACRGTKMELRDLIDDVEIAFTGNVAVDEIKDEMQRILNDTSPDVTVDAGGHSLGTTLLLKAYSDDPLIKKRIRQTFLYNPAASPVADLEGFENETEVFEQDETVRYFINLSDVVSSGLQGSEPPVNAVYRAGNPLAPMQSHGIGEWYTGDWAQVNKQQLELENEELRDKAYAGKPGQLATSAVDPSGARFTVRFGEDDWLKEFESQLGRAGDSFSQQPAFSGLRPEPTHKAHVQYAPGTIPKIDINYIRHMEGD